MKDFLVQLLGADNVRTDPQTLAIHAEDSTEAEPGRPDIVAYVQSADQIRPIVMKAAELRVPLVPSVYRTNIGGLTVPAEGGVVLDLTALNRVLEVNAEDMYAVIEPGVTQQILKDYLKDHGLPLTLGYSLAPPRTSVFANALLGGLTNRSLKYGDQSDWISGLEVVLPDGTIVRTGAWAMKGALPFGLVPFPDLTGLFVAWQGSTGIATKMAFQLWPLHPINRRLFVLSYSARATFDAVRALCRAEICDDIGGLSWPSGKMMLGVKRPHPVPSEGEPTFFLYIDLTAEIPEEMAAKVKILNGILARVRKDGHRLEDPLDIRTLLRVNPAMGQFAEFPTDLEFLTQHGGGGLSWIGTYGPLSRFADAADAATAVMVRYGFPPIIVSRPMRGGHFGVLRFISTFDKKDASEVSKVRTMNAELLDLLADRGFIMYKTPVWAWKALSPRLDPGMLDLLGRVKRLMDPQRIMNPGRMGL